MDFSPTMNKRQLFEYRYEPENFFSLPQDPVRPKPIRERRELLSNGNIKPILSARSSRITHQPTSVKSTRIQSATYTVTQTQNQASYETMFKAPSFLALQNNQFQTQEAPILAIEADPAIPQYTYNPNGQTKVKFIKSKQTNPEKNKAQKKRNRLFVRGKKSQQNDRYGSTFVEISHKHTPIEPCLPISEREKYLKPTVMQETETNSQIQELPQYRKYPAMKVYMSQRTVSHNIQKSDSENQKPVSLLKIDKVDNLKTKPLPNENDILCSPKKNQTQIVGQTARSNEQNSYQTLVVKTIGFQSLPQHESKKKIKLKQEIRPNSARVNGKHKHEAVTNKKTLHDKQIRIFEEDTDFNKVSKNDESSKPFIAAFSAIKNQSSCKQNTASDFNRKGARTIDTQILLKKQTSRVDTLYNWSETRQTPHNDDIVKKKFLVIQDQILQDKTKNRNHNVSVNVVTNRVDDETKKALIQGTLTQAQAAQLNLLTFLEPNDAQNGISMNASQSLNPNRQNTQESGMRTLLSKSSLEEARAPTAKIEDPGVLFEDQIEMKVNKVDESCQQVLKQDKPCQTSNSVQEKHIYMITAAGEPTLELKKPPTSKGKKIVSQVQKDMNKRTNMDLTKPLFETKTRNRIQLNVQQTIETMMSQINENEVQLLAALTVINNEKQALDSFEKNNKRASMRGHKSKELLSGINPYELLSEQDKELLVMAQKAVENQTIQVKPLLQIEGAPIETKRVPVTARNMKADVEQFNPKNGYVSVYEAEKDLASRGLLKKFSFTGSNPHMCNLISLTSNQQLEDQIKDDQQNQVQPAYSSPGSPQINTIVENQLSPGSSHSRLPADDQFTDLNSDRPINQQPVRQKRQRLHSARARIYQQASQIVQNQNLKNYSKQWANKQLEGLLLQYEGQVTEQTLKQHSCLQNQNFQGLLHNIPIEDVEISVDSDNNIHSIEGMSKRKQKHGESHKSISNETPHLTSNKTRKSIFQVYQSKESAQGGFDKEQRSLYEQPQTPLDCLKLSEQEQEEVVINPFGAVSIHISH